MNITPGTSGVLSPYAKMNGLYFDDKNEPESSKFELKNDIKRILEEKGIQYIDMDIEDPTMYMDALNTLEKDAHDTMTVYGVSKDKYIITVEEIDLAEEEEKEKEEKKK